jgi:hypothetical protein
MVKLKFNVPEWSASMVEGINTEVNFAESNIETYVVIGSSELKTQSTLDSIKFFDTVSEIHLLESFDLTLKLPHKLHYKSGIIKALYNILESEDSSSWVNLVKIINHNITYNEAAKILDHMNAWTYCVNLNKPVIVVESGTIFTDKPPATHVPYQSLISLSSTEPLAYNTNLHCLSNTYAYSIDSLAALECFSNFIKEGLYDTLEKMLRVDKYAIYHNKCALYTYKNLGLN